MAVRLAVDELVERPAGDAEDGGVHDEVDAQEGPDVPPARRAHGHGIGRRSRLERMRLIRRLCGYYWK